MPCAPPQIVSGNDWVTSAVSIFVDASSVVRLPYTNEGDCGNPFR